MPAQTVLNMQQRTVPNSPNMPRGSDKEINELLDVSGALQKLNSVQMGSQGPMSRRVGKNGTRKQNNIIIGNLNVFLNQQ
jgi:hypothetical protein